jgi:hypothetical protein
MEEQRNDDAQQDIAQVNPRGGREQAPPFSPNIGFPNPGSPGEEMGTTPLPPSGDVGARDLAGDTDLIGDEQAFDRGIIDERRTGDTGGGMR